MEGGRLRGLRHLFLMNRALAFTELCHIFCRLFHNVNSELFFAEFWDFGVEEGSDKPIACTNSQSSPVQLQQLRRVMKGQWKETKPGEESWRTYCKVLLQISCCEIRVSPSSVIGLYIAYHVH